MTTGVKDVDLKILENLDDKTLYQFSKLNKYTRKLCKNEDFWRRRFISHFGKQNKTESRSWKNFYFKIIYYDKIYCTWSSRYDRFGEILKEGSKNIDLLEYFMNSWNGDYNTFIFYVAHSGVKELVDFFISKGAKNWDGGMCGAAEGGHQDLVDFFISKGGDDWEWAMYSAAKGGHQDLVDFFISKGAKEWNFGLKGAEQGKHKDLVKFFDNKLKALLKNGSVHVQEDIFM